MKYYNSNNISKWTLGFKKSHHENQFHKQNRTKDFFFFQMMVLATLLWTVISAFMDGIAASTILLIIVLISSFLIVRVPSILFCQIYIFSLQVIACVMIPSINTGTDFPQWRVYLNGAASILWAFIEYQSFILECISIVISITVPIIIMNMKKEYIAVLILFIFLLIVSRYLHNRGQRLLFLSLQSFEQWQEALEKTIPTFFIVSRFEFVTHQMYLHGITNLVVMMMITPTFLDQNRNFKKLMENNYKVNKKNSEDNKLYVEFLKSCEISSLSIQSASPRNELVINSNGVKHKNSGSFIDQDVQGKYQKTVIQNSSVNLKKPRASQQVEKKETNFFEFLLNKHDRIHTEFEKNKAEQEKENMVASNNPFYKAKNFLKKVRGQRDTPQSNCTLSNKIVDQKNILTKEDSFKIIYRNDQNVIWFKVKIVPLILQEPFLAISLQDITQIEEEKKTKKIEQDHLIVSLSIIQEIKQHLEVMYSYMSQQKAHQKLKQSIALSLNLILSTASIDKSKISISQFSLSSLVKELYSTFDQIQAIKIKIEKEEEENEENQMNTQQDIKAVKLCESQEEIRGSLLEFEQKDNYIHRKEQSIQSFPHNQLDFEEVVLEDSERNDSFNEQNFHKRNLKEEQTAYMKIEKYNKASINQILSSNQLVAQESLKSLNKKSSQLFQIQQIIGQSNSMVTSQKTDHDSQEKKQSFIMNRSSSMNSISQNVANINKSLRGKAQSNENLQAVFQLPQRSSTEKSKKSEKSKTNQISPFDPNKKNKLRQENGKNKKMPEVFVFPSYQNSSSLNRKQPQKSVKQNVASLIENPGEESGESELNIPKSDPIAKSIYSQNICTYTPIIHLKSMKNYPLKDAQIQSQFTSTAQQYLLSPIGSQAQMLEEEYQGTESISLKHKLEQDIPISVIPPAQPFSNILSIQTYVALRTSTNLAGSEIGNQLICDFDGGKMNQANQVQNQQNTSSPQSQQVEQNDITLTSNYRLIFLAISGLITTFQNSKVDILIKIRHQKLYSSIKFTIKSISNPQVSPNAKNKKQNEQTSPKGNASPIPNTLNPLSFTYPNPQLADSQNNGNLQIQQITLQPNSFRNMTPDNQIQQFYTQQALQFQVLQQQNSLQSQNSSYQPQYQQWQQSQSLRPLPQQQSTLQPPSSRRKPIQVPQFSSFQSLPQNKLGSLPKVITPTLKPHVMQNEEDFIKSLYGLNFSKNKQLCHKIWKSIKDIVCFLGPEAIDISHNQAEIEFFLNMNVINQNTPQINSKINDFNSQQQYLKPSRNSLFSTFQNKDVKGLNNNNNSNNNNNNNNNNNSNHNINNQQLQQQNGNVITTQISPKSLTNQNAGNLSNINVNASQNTSMNHLFEIPNNLTYQENSLTTFKQNQKSLSKKTLPLAISINSSNINTNSQETGFINRLRHQDETERQNQIQFPERRNSISSVSLLNVQAPPQEEGFQAQFVKNFSSKQTKFQQF